MYILMKNKKSLENKDGIVQKNLIGKNKRK